MIIIEHYRGYRIEIEIVYMSLGFIFKTEDGRY